MTMRRVVFLAPYVKHYRLPFFELLHEVLQQDGIHMSVVYGHPNSHHAARRDNVVPSGTYGRPVKSYWLADRLVYQAAWREIKDADLVITPAENKMLMNPLLIALRSAGARRVAFWGKGDIRAASLAHPDHWFRHKLAGAVDWWFAYTKESAKNLRELGVRCGITAVENAIDTAVIQRECESLNPQHVRDAKATLGIERGPVGVYCGNLSGNKRLDFLFAAVRTIRKELPEFSLIVVGNGPLRKNVEIVAAHDRFIHFVGPRVGKEKALILKMSDVFLLPGAVGLAILDAFAAHLPLITTELPGHGPEINYLQADKNGLITPHDVSAYAAAVVKLLKDPARFASMRHAARESAAQHTLEAMVRNFQVGIRECLGLPATNRRASVANTRYAPQSWQDQVEP